MISENDDFDVVMAPAYMIVDMFFIFRSNGEEVEIDLKSKSVTHQLTFIELRFIKNYYPFMTIENYKIKKKTYI